MKIVDTKSGIVWLDVKQFADTQHKNPVTIRQWCATGFVVELGYLLHCDTTGHWRIGIPPHHQSYREFA
jgi:hypothetical protein